MQRIKNILRGIRDFFPIHLLFSHFKYNIIVLIYWVLLFSIINGYFGQSFGLQFLFLSPEYLGESSFLSFLLLGFGLGGFIMAFHTYSYIRLGPKYPFIATLARPFFKFCINNSLLPGIFIFNLAYNIFMLQKRQEFIETNELLVFVISFIAGCLLFISIAFLYFFPTNKDLFKITGKRTEDFMEKSSNIKSTLHRKEKWYSDFLGENDDRYYYIGKNFKIKKSRSSRHYDIKVLNSVFSQNHTNASFFELALLISFFSIGLFRDYEIFQVPACVSIMMLFTIILMIVSAFFSWFKRWTYPIVFSIILMMNFLSKNTTTFNFDSYAFGLSYEKEDLVTYSPYQIRSQRLDAENFSKDKDQIELLLDNWKTKTEQQKPKLVILNSSGGGLRSAMWTFNVLQELDKVFDKQFSKHLQMITGASGGMVGAAYYRDLILQEKNELIADRLKKEYTMNMGKDLLNRISFSISTSDLFFRFQKVEINGHKYTKDRGHAFEQELISNLNGSLSGTLADYVQPERDASIPLLILTPTIINDGRRLLISSQHVGFLNASLTKKAASGLNPEVENVEYLKFFENNNPYDLSMSSALRMNATFPYIMPMVTMPTVPGMQIMDAGIRDNYGTKLTVQYMTALEDWIKENTSGVIIVKIRDTKKVLKNETYREIGLIDKLLLPFGNIYGNFPRVQDFDQDELMMTKMRNKKFPIDVVSFNLRENVQDQIALSWHLTKREKSIILGAFNSENNQKELKRLKDLLQY